MGDEADPRWRALIAAFFALTGVPLVCAPHDRTRQSRGATSADLTCAPQVLNTSFNTRPAEPIVEGPANALAAFLHVASEASGGEAVSGGEAASGAGGSAQGGAEEGAEEESAEEGGIDRLLLLLGDGRAALVRARRCPLAAAGAAAAIARAGEAGEAIRPGSASDALCEAVSFTAPRCEQARLGGLRATRRPGVRRFVSRIGARESGETTEVQLRSPPDGGGEEWADGAAGEWLAADGDAAAAETFTPDAPREAREHRSMGGRAGGEISHTRLM